MALLLAPSVFNELPVADKRIAPHLTPAGTAGPQQLPADLARDASRRLGIVSLVYASVWALQVGFNNFIAPVLSPDRPLDDAFPYPANPVAAVIIVASLALFVHTRRAACDCEMSLNLGLAYEVLVAAGIGIVNQWTPNTVGLSWLCVLVVVHAVIVPHTPARTLLVAMIAASMDLVGLGIARARGLEMPPTPVIMWFVLPNYLCAAVAAVVSGVVTRLGREVRTARELGSYRLGDLLGRGGMGEVYLARHRFLARPAAIKLIRLDPAMTPSARQGDVLVRRFRREAEAAASLHSPHTIRLYDFGLTDDGTLYYVMELLTGLDLETMVQRFGPQPANRAVHFLRQACHSLAEAHAVGLIHRDIKPANLFACRVGLETDFIKVLDFGLVKLTRAPAPEETPLARRPTWPQKSRWASVTSITAWISTLWGASDTGC
jgi:tRNA A-37 threonylcarbamoyl transferase component Bud32